MIILETLTNGNLNPSPPSPVLAEYDAWLEGEWKFRRGVIATNYQFASVSQAVETTGPFLCVCIGSRNAFARLVAPAWMNRSVVEEERLIAAVRTIPASVAKYKGEPFKIINWDWYDTIGLFWGL